MIVMKLELSVSKKFMLRTSGYIEEVVFTVIDLDKAESYPLNFVCLLPKSIEGKAKSSSKFLAIYGEKSSKLAIELLTNALRSEKDLAVRSEIEKRLNALQPMPIKAKCVSCGCIFEPEKFGRYLQKKCQTCRDKNKSS